MLIKPSDLYINTILGDFCQAKGITENTGVIKEAILAGMDAFRALYYAEMEEMLDEMANSHLNELAIKEHENGN